jgi:hypothetical protein
MMPAEPQPECWVIGAATSHGAVGEIMSSLHRQGPDSDTLGRLRQSAWRYRWLLAVAVLVGAVLGYGWAAREPTPYEGVSRVRMAFRCPDLARCVPVLRSRAEQLLSSSAVLQRAVKLSDSRVSAKTLRQALEVDVAKATDDADYTEMVVITIRVVDATAKGAAQLANAVSLASQQVMAEEEDAAARRRVAALAREQRQLDRELDALNRQLATQPGNARLRANRDARLRQLNGLEGLRSILMNSVEVWQEHAALPQEPVLPRPLQAAAIGGLLGLVVGAGLAWWRSRPSRRLTIAAAGER